MNNNPSCSDNVEEINKKIFSRNIASGNLETLLDPRPTPTKYIMPFQEANPPCHSQTIYYKDPNYFNPGNRLGCWSRFASNINDESILRNQILANQKNPQADYIPNSTSDLYNSTIPESNGSVESKFPNLFNANIIPEKNDNLGNLPNPSYLKNLGINLFNNVTRQQLKDS